MRRLILMLLLAASGAQAHDLGAPHHEPPGWTFDPWITMPLLLTALAFALGWRRLRRRSTRGVAGLRQRGKVFAIGFVVLAGALVSPLHAAGERSFAAHMLEHELLMLVAAPLLVLSRPLAIMLWAFPAAVRPTIGGIGTWPAVAATWRRLSAPVTATVVQAAALWLWHAPALFVRALASESWHAVQHLSFIVAALFFWTAMLSRHTAPAVAALCLVATSIVSGALGALMAFATSPWYAGYARLAMAPFGLVHAGAALLLLRQLLEAEVRHAR
jgi:putative membrane protein